MCVHIDRCAYFTVPEDLNPLLSVVNVLELGFETSIINFAKHSAATLFTYSASA